MTTLNDIMTKPAYYVDRMCNQKTDEDEYLFMKYGAYLFKQYPGIESVKSADVKVNHLLNALKIRAVESSSVNVTEMKRTLQRMKMNFNVERKLTAATEDVSISEHVGYLADAIETHICKLREYQKENRIMEGAMVNYSPIVPYQGYCVSPGATSEWVKPILEEFHKDLKETDINNDIAKLMKPMVIKDEKNAKKVIDNIYMNNIFSIIDSSDIVKESDLDVVYADLTSVSKTIDMSKYPALEYFAMLEYHYNRDIWSNGPVVTAIENLNNFFSCPTAELINSLVDANMVMESDITINDTYHHDTKLFKVLDTVDTNNTPYANYNIEKLLSVLRINTAYKCDEFCNTAFLKDANPQDYSFLEHQNQPVLIAIIKEKYLAIPFIDQTDDWKMKVLCIDTDDNITVNSFVNGDYDTARV